MQQREGMAVGSVRHVIRASALEAEDVRRVVAQGLELGDGALDHGRRPAAEDVGVGPRRRHRLLEHTRAAPSERRADG